MPEQKIIRTQVVVVMDRDVNSYGDTIFHDGEGNEYKLGNKRAQLSDQIVEGRAVQLGYATYMNREYIATAKLVEGELPEPVDKPIVESAIPKEKPKLVNYIDSETFKQRSMSVSYAKDLVVAGKIELKAMGEWANWFIKYIRNEEVK